MTEAKMNHLREVSTVTRDLCKLLYTYRQSDRAIMSVCVIDVMGRLVPVRQSDRDDARWHLDNCVPTGLRAMIV